MEQHNKVVLVPNPEQDIIPNENNLGRINERKRLSELERNNIVLKEKQDKMLATIDIVFERLDKITSALDKR